MNSIQKTLIMTAILIVTTGIIVFFIIIPVVNDISTLGNKIEMERVALENKYTSRRNIKNIISDLKYVNNGLETIEKQTVFNKEEIVKFATTLENLAKKNNLAQSIKLTPTNVGKEKLAQKYPIDITLSGSYIDVLKYLDAIERSELYIIIESTSINSSKNSRSREVLSSGDVKTNLSGYVYFSL